ncbi:MAG TPA: hypothetical protein VF077_00515 [Nitrospiraceae bacterium]
MKQYLIGGAIFWLLCPWARPALDIYFVPLLWLGVISLLCYGGQILWERLSK